MAAKDAGHEVQTFMSVWQLFHWTFYQDDGSPLDFVSVCSFGSSFSFFFSVKLKPVDASQANDMSHLLFHCEHICLK